jgi:hypothetical protein
LCLVGPLRKSFPKSANGNRGAGRQSRRTDSTEKNFVLKDGFVKKCAAQRMNISSVKTAAHFNQLDGKSFELKFFVE